MKFVHMQGWLNDPDGSVTLLYHEPIKHILDKAYELVSVKLEIGQKKLGQGELGCDWKIV